MHSFLRPQSLCWQKIAFVCASRFWLRENAEYERPAGRGHAFERLISLEPKARLTGGLLWWVPPSRAAESELELESAGVSSFDRSRSGKFLSTPTLARSRSLLQHFFIISFLIKMETKMETEHNVLTADGHDGLSCTVLLALGLRLFPG